MPPAASGLPLPLWGLDLASLYASYAGLIDFVLLALLLVTLCTCIAGRKGERRRLAAVVGLLLAAACAATAAVLGVDVRSLGPVPLSILILAASGAMYRLLRRMRFRRFGAACVGLVVIYLCVALYLPVGAAWLTKLVVPPDLLATLVLVLGILQGLSGRSRRKTTYHHAPNKRRRRRR